MGQTQRGRIRFPYGRLGNTFAISAGWILAALALWAGVIWLDAAYETSRFTLAPAGCPLARISAWNTDVAPACRGQ